jgi:hypothetical protein
MEWYINRMGLEWSWVALKNGGFEGRENGVGKEKLIPARSFPKTKYIPINNLFTYNFR